MTKSTKRTTATSPAPHVEPDLVDRIFDYLLAEFPQIAGAQFAEAKAAVRDEFSGEGVYIAARPMTARRELAASVLSLFNGRNATEVARQLQISRASVYRHLKQAGAGQKRLSFLGNETATLVVCQAGAAAKVAAAEPANHVGRRVDNQDN